jgi:nitrous oxidase accessory protein NosD
VIIHNVSITGSAKYGVLVANGTYTIHGVTVTVAQIYVHDSTATITDSIISFSPNAGIFVTGDTATQVLIERSKMISNSTGLLVESEGTAATTRISDCVITGNTTGVSTFGGGQIITFRNNTWAGNTTDGATPFSISLE